MRHISIGLDIGSTTIKVVALSEDHRLLYTDYVRHHYQVQKEFRKALARLEERFPGVEVHLGLTGMGAMEVASALALPFVQEVVAEGCFCQNGCKRSRLESALSLTVWR